MTGKRRLAVIGGDAAGMSGASQARRRLDAERLEIVAFERGPHTSYSACGIPYYAGGIVDDPENLVTRSPDVFRKDFDIDARTNCEVMEVDLDDRRVRGVDRTQGTDFDEPFDILLIATGAEPLRPEIPGIGSIGVHSLHTLESGIHLRQYLDSTRPKAAVVVGGGYIGLEMAEAFRERGIDTSLVEALDQPMATLDSDFGAYVTDALREAGVTTYLGEMVVGFEQSGGRVTGVVTRERTLPADVVAFGLGTRPNVTLARQAELRLGESGGIWVDTRMRTSVDDVWSAGDCAEQVHRVTKKPVNFHLGTIANKMGRIAGINIGGGDAEFPGVLGTAITRVSKLEIGRTGLSEFEAKTEGFDYSATVVRSRTKSKYFPGSMQMHIKVVTDRPTRRFLGAQIAGGEGSAKRIDVFAACLWNEMTVDDMANMDLSYAPPFATVWDAVLIAARKATEDLDS